MKTREELIDLAIGEVVRNVINFPEKVQARLLGQDMGPLRKKLTEAVVTALAAGGVSPTAPDETDLAQALFRTLYDAGVAFNSGDLIPRLTATVLAAGFRRSREATTEPQPITDADVELAEKTTREFADSVEYVSFYDYRKARMRAALEAVEATREASR
jgi:hypothetical protein